MEKPEVDLIEGLSPAISIEQKSSSHNPRSTVGTVTEIYDYLRLLYARVGDPRCPDHGVSLTATAVSEMVDRVLALPENTRLLLLAPIIRDRKGEYQQMLSGLRSQGFVRVRIDGTVYELDEAPALDKKKKHSIDVVIDRVVVHSDSAQRLAESFETALALANDIAVIQLVDQQGVGGEELLFSARYACPHCGYSLDELEPRMFSFNNPAGACPTCDGLGARQFFDPDRVVHDSSLSLAAGAIAGWDRRNAFYFNLLNFLAEHYGFDIEKPFDQLPANVRDTILNGSGSERIEFKYLRSHGRRSRRRTHSFEGVLPNMQRRYHESESPTLREDLGRYLTNQPLRILFRQSPSDGGAPRICSGAPDQQHHYPSGRRVIVFFYDRQSVGTPCRNCDTHHQRNQRSAALSLQRWTGIPLSRSGNRKPVRWRGKSVSG
ncbi:MAG: hypothetical protein CM1200mP41_08860 [Gammaproteobacteria bacterium]|nr:MAG: hypothetical protein CM1200mP41_08860 [Gammaproteobacteria bacterium]